MIPVQREAVLHLLPSVDPEQHVTIDSLWCSCAPDVEMTAENDEIGFEVLHVPFVIRKYGRRFEP